MRKRERQFQSDLRKVAAVMKCRIDVFYDTALPQRAYRDTKLLTEIMRMQHRQPFDCILTTANAVYCLELKCDNNAQKEHQRITEQRINEINPFAYFVIRKWEQSRKGILKTTVYDIIQGGKVIERCYDLTEVIQWFKKHKGE